MSLSIVLFLILLSTGTLMLLMRRRMDRESMRSMFWWLGLVLLCASAYPLRFTSLVAHLSGAFWGFWSCLLLGIVFSIMSKTVMRYSRWEDMTLLLGVICTVGGTLQMPTLCYAFMDAYTQGYTVAYMIMGFPVFMIGVAGVVGIASLFFDVGRVVSMLTGSPG